MRLAVDVMGGDRGPEELLHGIKLGLAAESGLSALWIVGRIEELRASAARIGLLDGRIHFHPATEVLTMDDDPAIAIRRKKDSSLLRAIELVREGQADAVISSGNTGAMIAGATFRLGRLEGVKRPTLACVMPTRTGAFVLVDGGANPECTPELLLQFAVMGSVYSHAMLGVERPRVGVISNGTEPGKGTELTRMAVELIGRTALNSQGYCEGYDLFTGGVDVAVCDGFVGNVVLKTSEGLGKTMGALLKAELKSNLIRRLGALLAMGGLRQIRHRLNPDTYGGAPLLGLQGNVFKIHGSANRFALKNAIRQSVRAVHQQLNATIIRELAQAAARLSTTAAISQP